MVNAKVGRYAVVIEGQVDNIILWDGVTPYDPGDGATLLLLDTDQPVDLGDPAPEEA